jgi:hypothetical protein
MLFNPPRAARARRGTVLVLAAFAMVAILGVVAIAVDGGYMLDKRRHVQATTDAVALAAADILYQKYPSYKGLDGDGAALAQGLRIAAENGYANDAVNSVVTIRFSPERYEGGPDKGTVIPAGYVEVYVQHNQSRFFSLLFSSSAVPIKSRAVARGTWAPFKNGILVLDLHMKSALNSHGNGVANVSNAPVIVNSDDAEAAVTSGGGSLQAPVFDITGGYSGAGFTGTINTQTEPVPDPLRYLPAPDKTTMTLRSSTPTKISGGNHVLHSGLYIGGIAIQGAAKVTMQPGIYYMDGGGFSYKGQGSLTGLEVMIYNDPAKDTQSEGITGTGGGSATLTPPKTGLYQGISFFQARDANIDAIFAGNGKFNVTGTVYAAAALVRVSGEGDVAVGSQYISRALDLGGNGNLNIPWNPNTTAPTRVLQLVQ